MGSITKKELRIVKLFTKVASICCALDAEWNNKFSMLSPRHLIESPVNTLSYYLQLVLVVLIHPAYTVWKVFITFTCPHQIVVLQMLALFFCAVAMASILTMLAPEYRKRDNRMLFNQLIFLTGRTGHSGDMSTRERRFAMTQLLFCICCCGFILIEVTFEVYFTWISSGSVLLAIVMGTLVALTGVRVCLGYGYSLMHMYLYFTLVQAVMRVDTRITDVKPYRCLMILCDSFNRSYCKAFLPAIKLTLSSVCMCSLVAAVKVRHMATSLYALLPLVLCAISLYCFLILMLAAQIISGFWQRSQEFLQNLRWYSREMSYLKEDDDGCNVRVAKSLRPLRIKVGGLYYMERQAKLTVADFILSGTVNVLVLLRK